MSDMKTPPSNVEAERAVLGSVLLDTTGRSEDRVMDLCLTGGIIPGMSGSPILQDGRLVGAVTHVLVDNPSRGYGIFIENMLDMAG